MVFNQEVVSVYLSCSDSGNQGLQEGLSCLSTLRAPTFASYPEHHHLHNVQPLPNFKSLVATNTTP